MVNYLLGAMTEEAQAEFEMRYFADDELFEQLMIVKEELLDAYARDQLSASERARFERHFLNSPQGRAQVSFAHALRQSLSEPSAETYVQTPQPGRWQTWFGSWSPRALWWSATAALLLLIAASWLLRENRRLHAELAALRAEQSTRLRREQALADELAALRAATPAPATSPSPTLTAPPARFDDSVVAIELSTTRSSGAVELSPKVSSLALRLRLNFQPVPGSCSASLSSSAGRTLKNYRGLRARRDQRGYFIDLRMAAAALKAGEYQVTVFGRDAEEKEDVRLVYPLIIERR